MCSMMFHSPVEVCIAFSMFTHVLRFPRGFPSKRELTSEKTRLLNEAIRYDVYKREFRSTMKLFNSFDVITHFILLLILLRFILILCICTVSIDVCTILLNESTDRSAVSLYYVDQFPERTIPFELHISRLVSESRLANCLM